MNNLQINTHAKPIVFPKDFVCIEQRADRNAPIAWNQCYFLGFCVTTDAGEIYEHAMIIADSHNNLMLAINEFQNTLVDFIKIKSKQDIRVIFLYNLMMHDPRLQIEAKRFGEVIESISPIIDAHDGIYIAIGYSMTNRLCFMKTASENALIAIDDARIDILEQFREGYIPTLVCQAHPATKDMNRLLRLAIQRYTQLLITSPVTTHYLH